MRSREGEGEGGPGHRAQPQLETPLFDANGQVVARPHGIGLSSGVLPARVVVLEAQTLGDFRARESAHVDGDVDGAARAAVDEKERLWAQMLARVASAGLVLNARNLPPPPPPPPPPPGPRQGFIVAPWRLMSRRLSR